MDSLITFWNNHKAWAKWILAIIFIAIIYPISLGLIKAIFGGGGNTAAISYVLPGFVKYLLLIALLVGGAVSGEKDNKASVILASAVAGVLFFYFTPTLTNWIGSATSIIPTSLVAGIFLIGLAILAKKLMDVPRLATVLFIGGTIFVVLSLVPLILPSSLKNSLVSIGTSLPTKKIRGVLIGLGAVKAIFIGAFLLFWIKQPLSVVRFLISGMLIIGVYYFTDTTQSAFLAKHHTINKAVETQQTVGRNSLSRLIAEMFAGDTRRNVLSRKKIAKTGIFYIPSDATLCESIRNGVCQPSSVTLNDALTKSFIVEGKTETIGNYSWEQVYLLKPGGTKVYVFAGDLIEDTKKAKTKLETTKTASLKAAGWQELVVSAPDRDGFVTPVTPPEAVGKRSIIFNSDTILEIRVNNGTPVPYNTKILTFPDPLHSGGLPDMKLKNPSAKHWVKFQ